MEAVVLLVLVLQISTITYAQDACPDGVSLVNCAVNPCDTAKCPNYPQAICKPNYCGGCHTEFFVNGGVVPCDGPVRCKKSCSRTLTPICGTDGITYDNLCQYSNARCDNKALKISFKGKCEDADKNQNNGDTSTTVYGNVKMPNEPSRKIPAESCLVINAYEHGSCKEGENCKTAPLGQTKITNILTLNYNSIPFKLDLTTTSSDKYELKAVLNVGWCQTDDDPVDMRKGDYHNDATTSFSWSKGRTSVTKDIAVTKSEQLGLPTDGDTKECTYEGKKFGVGDQRPDECNTCTCVVGGFWACTLMACLPDNSNNKKDDKKDCTKACTFEYDPQCGTDGVTYGNECALEIAMCENSSLKKRFVGDCQSPSKCFQDQDAGQSYLPLVGTYTVKCSVNGDYQSVQHHPSTGYYWCVDRKTGQKIPGSEKRGSRPDCGGDDSEKTMEVSGRLLFDPTIPSTLPSGSCVTVTVQEDIQCQEEVCDNPILGETTMRDIRMNGDDRYAQYKLMFKPSSQRSAQYVIQATLNMGWCERDGDNGDWIRDGDFNTDIAQTFSVSPENNQAIKDIALTRYDISSKNVGSLDCLKACTYSYVPVCGTDGVTYPNECNFLNAQCKDKSIKIKHSSECTGDKKENEVSGQLSFDASVPTVLPSGSCLHLSVQEDIQCEEDCDIPMLGEITIKEPRLRSDRSIDYNLKFKPGQSNGYVIGATLNIGWCKSGNDWIRRGDYKNDGLMQFNIQSGEYKTKRDVSMLQYASSGGEVDNASRKDTVKPCMAERQSKNSNIRPGQFVPECDQGGDYTAVQFHGSTGYYWCVNPKTGEKIEGTDSQFSYPDCGKHMKGCYHGQERKFHAEGSKFQPGQDPCESCRCQGGQVRCMAVGCVRPDCVNPIKTVGSCCDFTCRESTISGKVSIADTLQMPLKSGSCLVVELKSDKDCDDPICQNPAVASLTIRDPQLSDMEIPFVLNVPADVKAGGYVVTMTLNVGWCGENRKEWIRPGDYNNIYALKYYLAAEIKVNNVNAYMEEYQDEVLTRPEKSQDKAVYKVSGEIIVDPSIKTSLPVGSCLIISIQEHTHCQGPTCNNPILGETKITDPQLSSRKAIDYSLEFKSIQSGLYVMQATLNVGWCKSGSEWIRKGDYHNDFAQRFQLTGAATQARKDINIELYDPVTDPSMQTGDKQNTVSGRVVIPAVPPVPSPLPTGSCLVVFVQEDIQCQGIECDNPVLGEVRINNPQISSAKTIDYSLRFKSGKSRLYIVQATLNMGWCKTGKEWLRKGDYRNDFAHNFELPADSRMATKDVYVSQYGSPSGGITGKKERTDCQKEREAATKQNSVGQFIPTCDLNGDFSAVQTQASTRSFWCVDPKTGKKFEGSDKRFAAPDCSKHMKGCVMGLGKTFHAEGSRFQPGTDPCVTCKCSEGRAECVSTVCRQPDCVNAKKKDGTCCEYQCLESTISGKVELADDFPQGLPSGSCLVVKMQSGQFCDGLSCNNPELASLVVRDPQMIDATIPFSMTVPANVKTGGYVLTTVLNKGWCSDSKKNWIRSGDYKNIYALRYFLAPDIKINNVNAYMEQYISTDPTPDVGGSDADCIKPCTREYRPLCGSDNVTYPNECEFKNAQCKDKRLTIKNLFSCKDDQFSEVSGLVELDASAPSSLPSDSCLVVYVQDNRQCINCEIPILGEIRIENPGMNANKTIPYKLRFKSGENRGASGYTLQATLNMGWCKTKDEWIRYGDYNNDYSHIFYVPLDGSSAYRNVKIDLYQDPDSRNVSVPAQEKALEISGKVIFNWGSIGAIPSLPKGSCLWMHVQEDIQCEGPDCDIPILGEKSFDNLQFEDGRSIEYRMNFKAAQSNQYLISATVNMGWCRSKNSNDWIRVGDYHNEFVHSFVIPSGESSAVKDVEVDYYKSSDAVADNEKSYQVSGSVKFPAFISAALPKKSCLTVYVQENIQCQGMNCVNPILGETKITDPQMSSRKTVMYQLNFRPTRFREYILKATLNMGWCAFGDEWIRVGDYHNDVMHVFSMPFDQTTASKDIDVVLYDPNQMRNVSTGANKMLRISGQVQLDQSFPGSAPRGSCLTIYVQEDIMCEELDCDLPMLGETIIKDPKFGYNNTLGTSFIPYSFGFKQGNPAREYMIQATLNMGWCGTGDHWIQQGDYFNELAHPFTMGDYETFVSRNIYIKKYMKNETSVDDDYWHPRQLRSKTVKTERVPVHLAG